MDSYFKGSLKASLCVFRCVCGVVLAIFKCGWCSNGLCLFLAGCVLNTVFIRSLCAHHTELSALEMCCTLVHTPKKDHVCGQFDAGQIKGFLDFYVELASSSSIKMMTLKTVCAHCLVARKGST